MFLLSVESAPFKWVGLKFGSGHRRAGLGPAPTKYRELSGPSVGAGHWPARRRPLAAHIIRPIRGHLPLKGKAFGRPQGSPLRRTMAPSEIRREGQAPPLRGLRIPLMVWVGEALGPPARIYTESVGWETQAQSENRSKIKFCTPRAPVGPDSNAPKHS